MVGGYLFPYTAIYARDGKKSGQPVEVVVYPIIYKV